MPLSTGDRIGPYEILALIGKGGMGEVYPKLWAFGNANPKSWMEVDMRSSSKAALEALHARFKAAMTEAAEEENRRWNNRGPVNVSLEMAGYRPSGVTPRNRRFASNSARCVPRYRRVVSLGGRT